MNLISTIMLLLLGAMLVFVIVGLARAVATNLNPLVPLTQKSASATQKD